VVVDYPVLEAAKQCLQNSIDFFRNIYVVVVLFVIPLPALLFLGRLQYAGLWTQFNYIPPTKDAEETHLSY
jgi:hypothetical protein